MVKISCCVCGESVEVTIDELIEMEDDEILCNSCATEAFIWCTEQRIKPN